MATLFWSCYDSNTAGFVDKNGSINDNVYKFTPVTGGGKYGPSIICPMDGNEDSIRHGFSKITRIAMKDHELYECVYKNSTGDKACDVIIISNNKVTEILSNVHTYNGDTNYYHEKYHHAIIEEDPENDNRFTRILFTGSGWDELCDLKDEKIVDFKKAHSKNNYEMLMWFKTESDSEYLVQHEKNHKAYLYKLTKGTSAGYIIGKLQNYVTNIDFTEDEDKRILEIGYIDETTHAVSTRIMDKFKAAWQWEM